MKTKTNLTDWTRSAAWVSTSNFAEGIPYVAVMTLSLIMYKNTGLSNTDVTLYTAWLYLPWVIKPLWSPFVDVLMTKRFWILAMELIIGATLAGVAFTLPTSFWLQGTLCFFWLMAFSSATHDIAVDGFYMLGLDQQKQSVFVGVRSFFYRVSMILGQGALVMLAGKWQEETGRTAYSWGLVFYLMAAVFIALFAFHAFILPHPAEDSMKEKTNMSDIMKELGETVVTFFRKPQVVAGICFMLFYRMPEGLLVKISTLFLLDDAASGGLGLTEIQLGLVQGTVGVVGLVAGGIIGGILAGIYGLKRCLWPMVCAITLPDVVYVYLAYTLPSNLLIVNICVFVEQFGYGLGFTAYMLYLIYYSQGSHKTSHYALCTALMALSMMIPGMVAGALQEAVGYRTFFLIVMACCVVTFIVASYVKIDADFGMKKKQ